MMRIRIPVGTRVRTTQDAGSTDWALGTRVGVRWGAEGIIVGYFDSHSLLYKAEHHEDSPYRWGWYEPSELECVDVLDRLAMQIELSKNWADTVCRFGTVTLESEEAFQVLQDALIEAGVIDVSIEHVLYGGFLVEPIRYQVWAWLIHKRGQTPAGEIRRLIKSGTVTEEVYMEQGWMSLAINMNLRRVDDEAHT